MPPWECDDAPMHEALRKMGFQIDTPDWRLTHDWDWSQYALVVPRLVWNYQKFPEEFSSWIEKVNAASLLINPISILKWSSHKSYLRDLEAAGVPTMPTVWIKKGEESKVNTATSFQRRQAFMKPSVGSTSQGCLLFTVGDEDDSAIAHATEQLEKQDEILL